MSNNRLLRFSHELPLKPKQRLCDLLFGVRRKLIKAVTDTRWMTMETVTTVKVIAISCPRAGAAGRG